MWCSSSAEDLVEQPGGGDLADLAHVGGAVAQPLDRSHLDLHIGLEHLLQRLADVQREQSLVVGQPFEE
jgi:hypothetical protein